MQYRTHGNARLERGARRRGFTFIEMIIALAGAAVVALAVASTLFAVTSGSQGDKDLRSLVSRRSVLQARHSSAIRSSQMVLAHSADAVVLWMGDADDSDAPDLSELRRIEYDAANDQVTSYTAPNGVTDVAYLLTDNFLTITAALKGGASFPATLWGSDITAWTTVLDDVTAQQARLVTVRMTLQAGTTTDDLWFSAMLRN